MPAAYAGSVPLPWADEFDASRRTRPCANGSHDDCPHLAGGPGGAFNPRRLRPEFGVALCGCDCHATCPAAGGRAAVSFASWNDRCTCPGAAAERRRHAETGFDPPDLGQIFREKRRAAQARREAFQATRAGSAGLTRAQITERYLTELRDRGLPPPPAQVLDPIVDAIGGNYLPAARGLASTLGAVGTSLIRAARTIHDATRQDSQTDDIDPGQ